MAIEIKDLPFTPPPGASEGNQVGRSRSNDAGNNQQPAASAPAGATASDTVSLTDTAVQLRNLEKTLSDLPAVDSQRVERIRAAVADGSYEINPTRIAEKMIGFETTVTASSR